MKHFHKIHIRIFDIQNRLKITNPQQYNTFICVFIYLLLQWWIRGKAKYIPREHKRHLGKKKNTNRDLMEASYGGNSYTQIFGTCFSSSSQIKTDWFAMKWNRSNHFLRRQQIKSHQFLFGCWNEYLKERQQYYNKATANGVSVNHTSVIQRR